MHASSIQAIQQRETTISKCALLPRDAPASGAAPTHIPTPLPRGPLFCRPRRGACSRPQPARPRLSMATTLLQGLARVVGPFQATPPPPADRRGAASGAAAASGGRRSGGRRVTFAADLGDESEFYLVELPNNRVYR